jgi:hypothetical protein
MTAGRAPAAAYHVRRDTWRLGAVYSTNPRLQIRHMSFVCRYHTWDTGYGLQCLCNYPATIAIQAILNFFVLPHASGLSTDYY